MPKTFIFGHQNPDTDSICSALAYAHLKNALGDTKAVACRLGDVNKETEFVLDYFGVEAPQLIKSVKPQVSDLHFRDFNRLTDDNSVKFTTDVILSTPGRSLPVVDKEERLTGIISLSDLFPALTGRFDQRILADTHTPYGNIVRNLNGRTLGHTDSTQVTGRLFSTIELQETPALNPDDFILTAFSDAFLYDAFATGAKNVIVTDTPIGKKPLIPEDFDGYVIMTDYPFFEAFRILSQVIPIATFVKRDKLEYFLDYETIDDVKQNMLTSSHSYFPVVDEDGKVQALISRSDLIDYNRKKVILVDHNERSQSISGVEEAEIVEVIDHHRIADITTASPLYLRMEPVGCTATIVARIYKEKNVPIPRPMAGIMMSAIISDTLLFNSPTCTELDKEICKELADIAGVDLENYGKEMLISGSNIAEMTPQEIINTDRKHFTMGNYRVMVSQINTGDFKGIFKQLPAVLAAMEEECAEQGFDLAVLMITDIIMGGSEILVAGQAKELAEAAFDIHAEDISRYMPGFFSRKKQVVPPLMNAAAAAS